MKIYFRDIFLSLSSYFLSTLSFLLFIAIINQINLISALGIKSTTLYLKVSKMCLYMIPYLTSIITPLAFLISINLLLHKYRKENSFIALQTIGLGPKELNRPFYILGSIIVFITYIISFFIVPMTYTQFNSTQVEIRQQNISDMLEIGVIKNYLPELTIYIDSQKKDGSLKGIFISDMRIKGIKQTFSAESGQIVINQDKINLQLINGTYNKASEKESTFLEFATYSVLIDKIKKKIESNLSTDPNAMSFLALWKFNDQLNNNYNKIKIAFHQKIIWPLYSLFFLFVCLKIEWLFYYKYYSHSGGNKNQFISISISVVLAISNFIIPSASLGFIKTDILITYITPLLLLQIVTQVIESREKY